MDRSLQRLNELTFDEAQREFRKCCGSRRWVELITNARPFTSVEQLLAEASEIWRRLDTDDWLEAFRAHPKIGENKPQIEQSDQALNWSAQEQKGVDETHNDVRTALAEANNQYEQRFGFIYIICATGKTADEMLTILNARLLNDSATELHIAAEEQLKITQLRLQKLLA